MHLAVVAQNTIQGLQAEIPSQTFAFHFIQKLDALYVVMKRADPMMVAQLRKAALAIVAKRRVADVMRQSDCLSQILIETEASRNSSSGRGDESNMIHSRADVIVLGKVEDLCFVPQSPKGLRVDDSVNVPLKFRSEIIRVLGVSPAAALYSCECAWEQLSF